MRTGSGLHGIGRIDAEDCPEISLHNARPGRSVRALHPFRADGICRLDLSFGNDTRPTVRCPRCTQELKNETFITIFSDLFCPFLILIMTNEQLISARDHAAFLVDKFGEKFLAIFLRLEEEAAKIETQESALDRARRLAKSRRAA